MRRGRAAAYRHTMNTIDLNKQQNRQRDNYVQAPGLRPFAAIRNGGLVAYATTLSFFPAAYAVAETERDMAALIADALAATDAPASFLLPMRQHELFRLVPPGRPADRQADDLHDHRRASPAPRRLDPVRPLLTRATKETP
jgi:hypothetical protein